jgi:predicted HTH domain antitoxin
MNEKETLRFLAAKLYESGKLLLGQAAELADLLSLHSQKFLLIMMFP